MSKSSSPAPAPTVRLMREAEVLRITGQKRSTWWQGVREGRYPKPRKLGGTTVWISTEIEALVQRVVAGDKSVVLIQRSEQMRAARAVRTQNDLARKAASAPSPAPRKPGRPRKAVDAGGSAT